MKAYVQDFKKLFAQGLRPSADIPGEGQFLTRADNFVPWAGALVGAPRYTRSFELKESAEVFVTSQGTFVLTKSSLYQYTTELVRLVHGFAEGGRWFCADFGAWIVFSNNAAALTRNPISGSWSAIQYIGATICRFRGRLVKANGSVVEWSDIGSAQFNPETYINLLRKNTAGSAELYEIGTIRAVYPIGPAGAHPVGFVAYGSKGIAYLTPAPHEKAAGAMRISVVWFEGVPSAQAVVSADDTHFFIDELGSLHKLSLSGEAVAVKELDYREFIPTPETASLSWNSRDKELLVGLPTDSPFLLGSSLLINRYGVGTISSYIQSIARTGAGELVVHSPNRVLQQDTMLTSDVIKFDGSGFKTIEQIEVIGEYADSLFAAVSYKSEKTGAWLSTDFIPLNSAGCAYIGATGIEFRLHVASLDYTKIKIEKLAVTVSFVDKRFRRGVSNPYGNQASADAS